MNYREWEVTVPGEIKGDSVWKSEAYRLALFAADLGWHDATKLSTDKRTISVADQLYRAVGAVSADVEEGYSRGKAGIARGFTNTVWVPPVKRGDGISRVVMFWGRKSPGIVFSCSPRSRSSF